MQFTRTLDQAMEPPSAQLSVQRARRGRRDLLSPAVAASSVDKHVVEAHDTRSLTKLQASPHKQLEEAILGNQKLAPRKT